MSVAVTDDHARSGEAAGGTGRWAHARAALAAAEQRTGVRRPSPGPVRAPAAHVRRPSAAPGLGVARGLPVDPRLAALLPDGVLTPGGVIAVHGSMSLLLGMLAAASRDGAWVAFVGAPAASMLAASDAGLALERVALVPDPGPDAPAVVAALLDGMDVVVAGPRAALLDPDRRRLAARARERGAVIASTVPWPGALVALDVCAGTWWGVDAGAGWLQRRSVRVRRTGRGAAGRPVELDVEVPVVAREAVPGAAVSSSAGVRAGGPAGAEVPGPAAAEPAPAASPVGGLQVVA
ncbi:hypothetical protein [Xylanimonas allomyrinae]|uniref:hypothetical protein n=1 Tax=Xylanimonas allomyrinae TaxID=2509459 RepID=UPI001B86FFC4|nr:hypothetical protein [Xylanimonas allomyrinae]